MNLSKCHLEWSSVTARAMEDAIGDVVGKPLTFAYRRFELTDVALEVLADGLVRLKGTVELYESWYGHVFGDVFDPPGDWPTVSVSRHPWNPLRFLYGDTYETPYIGSVKRGEKQVDIVVPSSMVAGVP